MSCNTEKSMFSKPEKAKYNPQVQPSQRKTLFVFIIYENALLLALLTSALQYGRPAGVALPGTGSLLASTRELAGPRLPCSARVHRACPTGSLQLHQGSQADGKLAGGEPCCVYICPGMLHFQRNKDTAIESLHVNETISHSEQLGY